MKNPYFKPNASFDMVGCEIDDDHFELRQVVAPVGLWRFLTRLEVIEEGDLVRFTIAAPSNYYSIFNIAWSPAEGCGLAGKRLIDSGVAIEAIRGTPGQSSVVASPVLEVIELGVEKEDDE